MNRIFHNARRRRYRAWFTYHEVHVDHYKRICVQDVNECSSNPCSQHCHNTQGSFYCSCSHDYVLDPGNRRHCHSCKCSPGWERSGPCGWPLPACRRCRAGQFKTTDNSGPCLGCHACPAGQERLGCGGSSPGSCSSCSVGRFKPDQGMWNSLCASCAACPAPNTVKVRCGHALSGSRIARYRETISAIHPYCALWGCGCLNVANWVRYPLPLF